MLIKKNSDCHLFCEFGDICDKPSCSINYDYTKCYINYPNKIDKTEQENMNKT